DPAGPRPRRDTGSPRPRREPAWPRRVAATVRGDGPSHDGLEVGVADQLAVVELEELGHLALGEAAPRPHLLGLGVDGGVEVRRLVAHVLDHPPRLLPLYEQVDVVAPVPREAHVRLVDPA